MWLQRTKQITELQSVKGLRIETVMCTVIKNSKFGKTKILFCIDPNSTLQRNLLLRSRFRHTLFQHKT